MVDSIMNVESIGNHNLISYMMTMMIMMMNAWVDAEKNVLIVNLGGGGGTFYVSSLVTIEEECIFIFEVKASGQVCSCQQLCP